MAGDDILYGDWTIRFSPIGHPDGDWIYTHKNYDGPGDRRHGRAATAAACRDAVDEHESGEK